MGITAKCTYFGYILLLFRSCSHEVFPSSGKCIVFLPPQLFHVKHKKIQHSWSLIFFKECSMNIRSPDTNLMWMGRFIWAYVKVPKPNMHVLGTSWRLTASWNNFWQVVIRCIWQFYCIQVISIPQLSLWCVCVDHTVPLHIHRWCDRPLLCHFWRNPQGRAFIRSTRSFDVYEHKVYFQQIVSSGVLCK